MGKEDVFEGFGWHSSIGMDCALDGSTRFVTRLPNNIQARSMFVAAGKNFLIHKTTRCLWKLSDDNKTIEPVFSSDVLTDDDVKAAMEGK
jgi:hypothetical protein